MNEVRRAPKSSIHNNLFLIVWMTDKPRSSISLQTVIIRGYDNRASILDPYKAGAMFPLDQQGPLRINKDLLFTGERQEIPELQMKEGSPE